MGKPYREFGDGELIRSDAWNQIQTLVKQEIRTHQHGGGGEGESDPALLGAQLRSDALLDNAVTTEKIAENAVSSRVLADGALTVAQFRPDAAVDESKVAFDPDEPAARATARVVLEMPEDAAATPDLVWSIPEGTPVTNDAGDLVFRTSEPVALEAQKTEVEVAARAEFIGAKGNVPAGTLTRIGGALDPFLRNHLSIEQLTPSLGGSEATGDTPPLRAWTDVEFRAEGTTPPTFWVVPKGTRVWYQPEDGSAAIAARTRQSLSVFPRSTWVLAECEAAGAQGNLPVGSLRAPLDAALATRLTIDQPEAATGGDTDTPARVRLRLRGIGTASEIPLVVPAGTEIQGPETLRFRTLEAVTVDDGGVDYVLADLEDATQSMPSELLTVEPTTRLRLDKIYDPALLRHLSAVSDESFDAPADQPQLVRLGFSFSARTPRSAWAILAGTQLTVGQGSHDGDDDPARPIPVFETEEALTVLPRSGWVRADALTAGSDFNLPAGSLNTVMSLPSNQALAEWLEVDQLLDAGGGEFGFATVLVRFRVIESAPLPSGQSGWVVPAGAVISDGEGKIFSTRAALPITRGGSGLVLAVSRNPGEAGNVPAGTLERVHPDTRARIGNIVDRTLVPYLSVSQPEDASGGGESLQRARTRVWLEVSDLAPRTAWLVPGDTRVSRVSATNVRFSSVDPSALLPRTTWATALLTLDSLTDALPAGSLTRLVEFPDAHEGLEQGLVEVYQPDAGEDGEVRVWFRVYPDAAPSDGTGWRIPAGTIVGNASATILCVTTSDVFVDEGGADVSILESELPGAAYNGIDDLRVLARVDDFEKRVLVRQPEPAKDGADGGSQGHHHKLEDGALHSTPLAAQSVGAEQLAPGAVLWGRLSPALAERLRRMRDQLQAVEDAMIEAGALQALTQQRHQSAG
ncbi:hypothetical protein Hoch_1549 [Haliangium ochraceum DSM 14365]|uniref:Baseplate protein J-like barrel domain-containing protein n=1 Tax=Haliangium ochraceum (strain DSM 14365 / JCM 11303 / SMP-2) TaxID=502025 RepID=D0LVW7_HALO1|nr:hypothetical protein Hoch_1549 [Haliangium ochraceum DSM 14365]